MEELANDSSSGAFTLKHCAFSVSSAVISARRACGHDSRSKTTATSTAPNILDAVARCCL